MATEIGKATEKGKNLATKEDIGEITEKIENVKSAYAADLEEIKSTLTAINQQRLHLFEKRTDAMIQFFEDASILLSSLKADWGFRYSDIEGLDKFIGDVNRRIWNMYTSFYRLVVYCFSTLVQNYALSAQDFSCYTSQRVLEVWL